MKTTITAIFLIVLFPSFSFSGEIYGCIKEGRKFIGEGAKVEIKYDDNADSINIDEYSPCNLYAPEKGRCILKMYYKGQIAPNFILFSFFPFAGEIYECIEGRRLIDARVTVKITPDVSTETDKYGTYSLYVPKEGRCILKVHYKGQTTQDFRVRSYESSVQYDLLLKMEEGKYILYMRK